MQQHMQYFPFHARTHPCPFNVDVVGIMIAGILLANPL